MPDTVDFLSAFSKAQQLYASYGITTVQEGMFVPQLTGLYQSLLLHHTLSLDVVGYSTPEDFPSLAQAFPRSVGQYHHRFKLGGYKIFLDGSPQGRTAWLRRPYEDAGDYWRLPDAHRQPSLWRLLPGSQAEAPASRPLQRRCRL